MDNANITRNKGVINNFYTFTPAILYNMKCELGLYMTVEDLIFCQRHFHTFERRHPYFDEIYLIDEIIRHNRPRPSNSSIRNLRIADTHIMKTYEDVLQKAKALKINTEKLSLVEIAAIPSKYMNTIGKKPASNEVYGDTSPIPSAQIFTDECGNILTQIEDDTAPLYVNNSYGNTTGYGYGNYGGFQGSVIMAILLVTPVCGGFDSENYRKNTAEFLANPEVKRLVNNTETVSGYGLATTLTAIYKGVFADLSRLPRPDGEYPEIWHFAGEYSGGFLVVTLKNNIDFLNSIAAENGLNLCYFAKVLPNDDKFVIQHPSGAVMPVLSSFIKAISNPSMLFDYLISPQNAHDNFERKKVFTGNGEKELKSAIQFEDKLLYISAGDITSDAFIKGVNIALDAVMGLMCTGVSRRDITLSVNYGISDSLCTEEDFGKNLSLLLGVYRTVIELNLPDVNSKVNFTDSDKTSLAVAAFAKKPQYPSPSRKFCTERKNIYFLSFNNITGSFPDFASFRSMSDYAYSLFKTGDILSAHPVCGNLISALEEMSQNGLGFEMTREGANFANAGTHGILVETKQEINQLTVAKTVARMSFPETNNIQM